jgi:hypothetical protein
MSRGRMPQQVPWAADCCGLAVGRHVPRLTGSVKSYLDNGQTSMPAGGQADDVAVLLLDVGIVVGFVRAESGEVDVFVTGPCD